MAFAAIGVALGATAAAATLTGAAATVAVVGAAGAATNSAVKGGKNKRASRLANAQARREEERLERFESMRQPVINQAGKIRALKSQVFNPAANMGVAMKASEIQMEETDKALANTLDAISAGGPGAGNATALAQMAAVSKAQVAAGIENQEASNMQLRIAGETTRQKAIQDLETTALAEEVSAYGRQEERDLSKMDRMAGLADRSREMGVNYEQAADQNSADMWGSITDMGMAGMSGLSPPKKK
jgi:1-aminocyclopropane-1-carboxylate deaminase/D-cysteine desulfhydrase-like pyridoxal-dependent ACC family enzyme